jgi:hypothetical protein
MHSGQALERCPEYVVTIYYFLESLIQNIRAKVSLYQDGALRLINRALLLRQPETSLLRRETVTFNNFSLLHYCGSPVGTARSSILKITITRK